MGALGGFLGGMGQGVQKANQQKGNQQKGNQPGGLLGTTPLGLAAPKSPASSGGGQAAPTQAQPSAPALTAGASQPINTQTQQSGFHGLVPMAMNYYQNHQAQVQDASAQPHIQSLQDPNITPEQRQYHVSALQQTYAGRPEVLSQLGIPNPHAYGVPNVGASSAAPAAATPAAATVDGGGQ